MRIRHRASNSIRVLLACAFGLVFVNNPGYRSATVKEVRQMRFDNQEKAVVGNHGSLTLVEKDEVSRKLVMLIEGECEGLAP